MKKCFLYIILVHFIAVVNVSLGQDISASNILSSQNCASGIYNNINVSYTVTNNHVTTINRLITVSYYYGNPFLTNAKKIYQDSYLINLTNGASVILNESIPSPSIRSDSLFVILNDGGSFTTPFTQIDTLFFESNTNNNIVKELVNACQEICDDGIDNDNDGLLDCYDEFCACDSNTGNRHPYCQGFFYGNCDPNCSVKPIPPILDAQLMWVSTGPSMDSRQSPTVGDIDNDGVTEVLGRNATGVFIFDGQTGVLKNSNTTLNLIAYLDAIPFADVDGDGTSELFVTKNDHSLARLEHDLTVTWSQPANTLVSLTAGQGWSEYSPGIADFNGDGQPELFVGNYIINAATGNIIANGSGNIGHQQPANGGYLYPAAYDILPPGFCANCDGLELICGSQIYSVDVATGTMNIEVEANGLIGVDGFTSIGDMDNDGDPDIVFSTVSGGAKVYIWDGQTNTILATYNAGGGNVSLPTIADFDGDGLNEVSICVPNRYDLIEDIISSGPTANVKWSLPTSDGSGFTGSTVYDFNGDGIFEVVYRDETDLRIIDGPSGTTLYTTPCTSSTRTEYPVVADINNDDETEIVCGCNNRIRAFESSTFPWIRSRAVWNQFMYNITNINDDFTVPRSPTKNHFIPSLNNYLTQSPYLTFSGVGIYKAPDAIINVLNTSLSGYCPGDSIKIVYEVCNVGDVPLGDSIPISFYQENPTTNITSILLDTSFIDSNILNGSCVIDSFYFPITNSIDSIIIYPVVNANSSLTPAFQLDTNHFPNSNIYECDYSNNMDSVIIYLDTVPPVAICKDTTIYLIPGGIYTIDTSYVNNGSYDSCGLDSVWLSNYTFDCSNKGLNQVTLYVRDFIGNMDSCISNITVLDTIPVALAGVDTNLCNQYTLTLNANVVQPSFTGFWSYLTSSTSIPTFSNINDPIATVSNLVEGTYSLIWGVTNNTCDTVYDTLIINVFDQPFANAGPDQNLCAVNTALLIANTPTGLANGRWYVDSTASNPTFPIFSNPTSEITNVSNLQEGTYTIIWEISNGFCPPDYDTIIIEIYDQPKANAGKDTILCNLYDLFLYGNQPNGSTVGRWLVDPGSVPPSTPIFSDSSLYNSYVSGLVEGTYRFLWILQNGSCPISVDTIVINVFDEPQAIAGNDTALCNVYQLPLNANAPTGRSKGRWYENTSFGNPSTPIFASSTQNNTIVNGLIEGTYELIWEVSNSPCFVYTDTIQITIYDQPIASVSPDQFLCDYDSTTISAIPPVGSASGFWNIASATPNSPTYNTALSTTNVGSMLEAGIYTFYYEVSNGICPVDRDSITIFNNPIPQSNFTQDTLIICQNGCVQFSDQSTIHPSDSIISYNWKVGGNTYNDTNPYICFPNEGSYHVSLITTSSNNCSDTTVKFDWITVYSNPVADFNYFLVDDPDISSKIQIQDNSYNSTSYWYNFGDGDTTTIQNPGHIYYDSGFYDITQIVTNNFGCKDTLVRTIFVNILLVYVPNTFTPNGDGKNEYFFPSVLGDDPDSYLFRVFNRWGQLLYETQLQNKGWDGTFKGKKVKTDTYIWTVKAKYKDGERENIYRGHVNLMR